jgi:hypothetical protein
MLYLMVRNIEDTFIQSLLHWTIKQYFRLTRSVRILFLRVEEKKCTKRICGHVNLLRDICR